MRLLLALASPSRLLSRGAVLCHLMSGGFVGALTHVCRVAHHKPGCSVLHRSGSVVVCAHAWRARVRRSRDLSYLHRVFLSVLDI